MNNYQFCKCQAKILASKNIFASVLIAQNTTLLGLYEQIKMEQKGIENRASHNPHFAPIVSIALDE